MTLYMYMYKCDELCDIVLFTECNMPKNFIVFTPCVKLKLVNVDQLNTSFQGLYCFDLDSS